MATTSIGTLQKSLEFQISVRNNALNPKQKERAIKAIERLKAQIDAIQPPVKPRWFK